MSVQSRNAFSTQNDGHENGVMAVKNLLQLAKVKVTNSSIDEIKDHEGYPSLATISESLHDWNVDNMGVRITADELPNIPYPAIAHLHKNDGHFVVLQEWKHNEVSYIDPDIGLITEPVQAFEKKWTGAALLISPNENSGEDNFFKKKRAEVLQRVRITAIYILLLVCLTIVFVQVIQVEGSLSLFALFILKIFGLGICILLLQTQFSIGGKLVSTLCEAGKKSSCSEVLHSPAAKIFGVSMSEVGAVYFGGGLLAIIFCVFLERTQPGLLSIITVCALPYTLFSFYYQWRKVKTWCPLCLAVVSVLWLEFLLQAYSMTLPFQFFPYFRDLSITTIAFLIPILFWLSVRQFVINGAHARSAQKALNKLKRSRTVFKAVLNKQPTTISTGFKTDVVLGNSHAHQTLLMVTNPSCAPCATSHRSIHKLIKAWPEKLRVEIVFMSDPLQKQSISTRVSESIIRVADARDTEMTQKVLSAWYEKKNKTELEGWIESLPPTQSSACQQTLDQHYRWCKANDIKVTPSFFLNNRKVPSEYSVADLCYHIRHSRVD